MGDVRKQNDVLGKELEDVRKQNEDLGKEVEDVRKQNEDLIKEVSRKRKEAKDETQRRRGWRDKYEVKKNEAEHLKRKSQELNSDLERLSEALFRERQENKEEVAAMMLRVKNLEAAEDELLEMATKFGLAEVEDEIYRDGALENLTEERNDAPTDETTIDEEACSDLPISGTSKVEEEETEKEDNENRAAKRRRLTTLGDSISSVDSEVGESFSKNVLPAAYQGGTQGKEAEKDNFDFSLLDSSQEDASA